MTRKPKAAIKIHAQVENIFLIIWINLVLCPNFLSLILLNEQPFFKIELLKSWNLKTKPEQGWKINGSTLYSIIIVMQSKITSIVQFI